MTYETLLDQYPAQLKDAAHELTVGDATSTTQSWQMLFDMHHALVEQAIYRNAARRP